VNVQPLFLLMCDVAQEVMRLGCSPVVIDNTNTQAWQMLPYVRLVGHFSISDNLCVMHFIVAVCCRRHFGTVVP